MTTSIAPSFDRADEEWLPEGLERLNRCPVCRSESREPLYENLTDDTFACAAGNWSLHRCNGCGNGYLDPRPDEKSIGLAYRSYYTHSRGAIREEYDQLGALRKFRRMVSNGYTNNKYGTSYSPSSSRMGRMVRWIPALRQGLDVQFRWLPRPRPGDRILDVGCGNGAFLGLAASCGWEAYGVDPDPGAIQQAHSRAKEARLGGIDAFADMEGRFRAITFSHSIEHVHDPRHVMRNAFKLLEENGVLYVDTPNIDSRGRLRFGRKWRGLEVPRHLVLFTPNGLEKVLEEEGFRVESRVRRTSVSAGMYWSSQLITCGQSPYDQPSRKLRLVSRIWAALSCITSWSRLEFITLVARRISS